MDEFIKNLSKTKEQIIQETLNRVNHKSPSIKSETKDHSKEEHKHHHKKFNESFKNLIHTAKNLEKLIKKTFSRLFNVIDKKQHQDFHSLKEEVFHSLEEHHNRLKKHKEQTPELNEPAVKEEKNKEPT